MDPALIDVIKSFSHFSSYKVNLAKSEAISLGTLSTIPITVPSFPPKCSPNGYVYLGIFIHPSFDELYRANFAPVLSKVQQDLECWTSLPVSSLARTSLVKMNVLPRLLYPFQMIPVLFSKRVLKDIKGWLSSFTPTKLNRWLRRAQ